MPEAQIADVRAPVSILDGIQNMMETYLIMKGFSVGISDLIADDKTREDMENAITDWASKLKDYDVGLFYYSGHGAEPDAFCWRPSKLGLCA